MIVLALETSCDETSASVVEDGNRILSNVIASQIEIHSRYGGVVPEVASRQHMLSIVPVIQQAMDEAKIGWKQIDAIAVTIDRGQSPRGSYLCQLAYRSKDRISGDLPDRLRRTQRFGIDEGTRSI